MKYLICLILLWPFLNTSEAQVRYVKPAASGTADGSSWANASSDLQAMINVAGAHEVWVAAGTYKPTSGTDRTISFYLQTDVGVYGGFTGGETALNQRNVILNETILSGNIGSDQTISDNSYHVLRTNSGQTNTAILDGFTIRDGNADFYTNTSGVDGYGGGLLNYNASPLIRNCLFYKNTAYYGGGFESNLTGIVIFENCTFKENHAIYAGGGVSTYQSNPSFTSCRFENNDSQNNAGAFFNEHSSPTISTCTFINNQAASSGGAIDNFDRSSPIITSCTFTGNTSLNFGGAIDNDNKSEAVISSCIFTNNQTTSGTSGGGGAVAIGNGYGVQIIDCDFFSNASYTGGAIYCYSGSGSTFQKNVFKNNSALTSGGAIFTNAGTITTENCLFIGNTAGDGGAVFGLNFTNGYFTNCTFDLNTATGAGQTFKWSLGNMFFVNLIVWNSGFSQQIDSGSATLYLYNSLVKNGVSTCNSCPSGNGNVDPLFVNPADADGADNLWRTADDGYNLQALSPAIDNGDTANGTTTDLRGISRSNSDIGAYEFVAFNCPETLQVIGVLNSNQKANQSIVTLSPNSIQAGTSVIYQAGNYVQLNPGFSTGTNSVFITKLLAGCQ